MKKYYLTSLITIIFILTPVAAETAGMFLPFRGIFPMGRAGAVNTSARDPNALTLNPALLALAEGHQILVDISFAALNLTFQRDPRTNRNNTKTQFEEVRNIAPGIVIPQVLFSTDFGTDTLALGAGIFPPYAAPSRFSPTGSQRYAIIDISNNIIITQAIAFAYRPHPIVSIGAGVQNVTAILEGVGISSIYLGVLGEPEDPDLDSLIRAKASDWLTPSANFGIWIQPLPFLETSLSFQLFADIKTKNGKYEAALPSTYIYEVSHLKGKNIDMELSLPWFIRWGLRYTHPRFDIELNAWFERWSRHKTVEVIPHNIAVTDIPLVEDTEVEGFTLNRKAKDTFGLAIGSDIKIIPNLTLRTGFLYESGAAPDAYYSVFFADNHKLAPTIGLSYEWNFIRFDFAFAHVHQLPKNLKNGTLKQYNIVYPEGANITNNGKYKSYFDFIGIGLNFKI